MSTINTVKLGLTDRQINDVRDALAEEMMRACEVLCEHLREHRNGSNVALADARDWLDTLNRLADCMSKLDAPGWREPLGKMRLGAV